MATTTTLYLPMNLHSGPVTNRDGRWFRDYDGAIATTKRNDELVKVTLDWTDLLASGETVSSAAYTDSGVTRSSTSVSTPQTITSVTGLGEFKIVMTSSASRTPEVVIRFYDSAAGRTMVRDYA